MMNFFVGNWTLFILTLLSVNAGRPTLISNGIGQNRVHSFTQHNSLAFFTWPDTFMTKAKQLPDGEDNVFYSESGICDSRLRGGAETVKGAVDVILGPTTRPLSQALKSAVLAIQSQFGQSVKKEDPAPMSTVQHGALSEYIYMLQAQESALLQQAAQCRAAATRLIYLQQLLYTKIYGQSGEPQNRADLEREEAMWKAAALEMHQSLNRCFTSASKDIAALLGEKAPSLPVFATLKAAELQTVFDSAVTPDHHSEVDEEVAAAKAAKRESSLAVAGPTVRPVEKMRFTVPQVHLDISSVAVRAFLTIVDKSQYFSPEIEGRYRVGTWNGFAVYGAVADASRTVFEYAGDTELHLVWDIDQTKLVGEGTNDVELVMKCVLWWKEELKHDKDFIPSAVPEAIKKEFREYCSQFDIYKAVREVIHFLVRPKIREFVQQHPQARWWTFTNKDREVAGQIVRDVSDEDGLVGMFQTNPHEVSGKQVLDTNKCSLQVLEECANEYLGIVNEERPIIGVRGQTKNLERVAKLIQDKRQKNGEPPSRPVTIVLIDDRKQDAYGKCQANDIRCLCHVAPYSAITQEQGVALTAAMEKILPSDRLLRFYQAFKKADPTHALIQCVEIMSDDQSMLLKRVGSDDTTRFEYRPKTTPALSLPQLPVFKRAVCRSL